MKNVLNLFVIISLMAVGLINCSKSHSKKTCGGQICAENEYCDYVEECGDNDEQGTCKERPTGCADDYSPVCGCNNQTYGNECLAYVDGVDILHTGECEEDNCDAMDVQGVGVCAMVIGVSWNGYECVSISGCSCDGSDCDELYSTIEECEQAYSDCITDCPDPDDPDVHYVSEDPEECAVVDYTCNENQTAFDNECGCGCIDNEVTYCGGEEGLTCANDEYCDFDEGCGDWDQMGICRERPSNCNEDDYYPVCGCNNQTYESECLALLNGVDVLHTGTCEGTNCDAMDAQGEGSCYLIIGFAWNGSECTYIDGCSCEGSDCDELYNTIEECEQAYSDCIIDCPDPDDPDVTYISDDPVECAQMVFSCEDGSTPFNNECGCGCIEGEVRYCGGEVGLSCYDDEYCDFENGCGFDDSMGICKKRPIDCELDGDNPVCGCNYQTYADECVAYLNGVDVLHIGECEENNCDAMDAWGDGSCFQLIGYSWNGDSCIAITGCECFGSDCNNLFSTIEECEDAFIDCTQDCPDPDDPDVTYISDDPDECAQIDFDCDEPGVPFNNECGCGCIIYSEPIYCGGVTGETCDEDEYCDYSEDSCGYFGQDGICRKRPIDQCDDNYDPVCGCNNQTYGNECLAYSDGVDIKFYSECEDCEPMDASGVGGCDMEIGYIWDGYMCKSISGCSCEGTDCDNVFDVLDNCEEEYNYCRDFCPSINDPDVHYVSQNPQECETIYFICEEFQLIFNNECGCGCIDFIHT